MGKNKEWERRWKRKRRREEERRNSFSWQQEKERDEFLLVGRYFWGSKDIRMGNGVGSLAEKRPKKKQSYK